MGVNSNLVMEEEKKELEKSMEEIVRRGRTCGLSDDEMEDMFLIVLKG